MAHRSSAQKSTAVKALSRENERLPLPAGLGDAFAQLLAGLRQNITSLGLAFKPPATVPAAIQQLEKISEQIGQLISCVIIAEGEMAKEWKEGMESIGAEVDRHLEVLESEGDYLTSTGVVWEAIDQLAHGLSKDERSAVERRWKTQQCTVKDAWAEFKKILEGEEAEEEEDDGWGEFGLGGSSLTEQEKATAEAAKPILALHQILHASVPKYLDDCEKEWQPLLQASERFTDAYDGAVSAMYSEQDEEEIDEALEELEQVSREIAKTVKDKSMTRWLERFDLEKEKWASRKMSLGALSAALE
ncbi:hypothetical protein IAT38_001292 [Cryptococcus sp. DSM 104549]